MSYYGMLWPSYFDGPTGREIVKLGGPAAQACGAYLASAHEANMLGLYRVTLAMLKLRLGWPQMKAVEKALSVLGTAGFADYDRITEHVWVRQMAHYRLQLNKKRLESGDKRLGFIAQLYADAEPNPFLGPFFTQYAKALHLTVPRSYDGPLAVLRLPELPTNDAGAVIAIRPSIAPTLGPPLGPPMSEAVEQKQLAVEQQQGVRADRAPAPTRALLQRFIDLHHGKFGVPAVIHGAKDAALLANLHRTHGEHLDGLMADFFASTDPFIAKAGYTVGVFVSQFGKLLTQRVNGHSPQDPNASAWADTEARLEARRR